MIYYLYLALAIIFELLGTNCMKASNGFSKLPYSLATLMTYGLCFFFLSLSLKGIQLNVAYAIWGGLGIVLAAVVSVFIWNETLNIASILGIALIVSGVVVLNLFGTGH